jgi:putative hemolysin
MLVLFVVFMTFFATMFLAVRSFSLTKLEEHLERQGKAEWMEFLSRKQTDLVLTCATMEAFSIVGTVLSVARATGAGAEGGAHIEELYAFLASVGLLLVFGTAIPFAVSEYAGERLLSHTLALLHILSLALWPVVRVLSMLEPLARQVAGERNNGSPAEQAGQEILDVVSESEKQGLVDEREKQMIESVIELRETDVSQIMTPRTAMVGVAADADLETVKETVRRGGRSRYPVYEDTIDHILGVLYVKDLLLAEPGQNPDLRKLMRKVPFVPESKPLRELLRQFQEKTVHMAIVLDEYGGTAGLVTIEDILEELVGEIMDEHDVSRPEPVQRIDADTIDVEAKLRIEELNESLDVDIPESEDYETVGGFVFAKLGKIPRTGEEFSHNNLQIRVLDAEERKINRLRVHVNREAEGEA